MKLGISADLLAHYQGDTTTLAMCWKVTRTDDAVFGFTAHDADILFDALTYVAAIGFTPSAAETQTRLAVDNLETVGIIDDEQITEGDLLAGVWDYARVEVFMVNWADTSMGRDVLMTGHLGQATIEAGRYTAELRGLTDAYTSTVGQLYAPTCRAQLGDSRCGVNLSGVSPDSDAIPFTVTGTLDDSADSGIVLFDAARIEPGPSGGQAIIGITNAALPVVECTAHPFVAQQVVYVSGVVGMMEVNGGFYVVAGVPDVDHFTLANIDSTAWGVYVSGGEAVAQGDTGWFDYGLITMTSGASAGLSMEVKAYSPGTITLQLELAHGAGAGDTYSMRVGCGKRFAEDCVGKFANGVNFRGEPHVPGMDRLMWVGGQER